MIRLKNFDLPDVVQSPMANCTDLPFRTIARSQGMAFSFLEMLSSETLVRNKSDDRLDTTPEDRPVGAQIVGCLPEVMAEAAAKLEALGFDLIDINVGCPVPKITGNGGGSQLLREPSAAEKIFKAVVRSVTKIPVTVKMRLGYSDSSGEEAIKIARIAEDSGVDAIAVHGRTRTQGYSGTADYEAIGRIKKSVCLPVIGNGDVVDGPSAVRLRKISGCDGVMLGRGALGNPWIYRQVQAALEGHPVPSPPTWAERKNLLLKHIELQCQYEREPIGPLRRILCWYYRDVPGAAQFRAAAHHAQTIEDMLVLIDETFQE